MQHSKTSTAVGSSGEKLGERHEFLGQMGDERGLDELGSINFSNTAFVTSKS